MRRTPPAGPVERSKLGLRLGAVLAALACGATVAGAQGASYGQRLYAQYCTACHGTDGTGGGAMAHLFPDPLTDLTLLQRENGGLFPFRQVYESIDGRRVVRAHGTEMPVWGRALLRVPDDAETDRLRALDMTPEEIVQARILALTYYIQTMQK